MTTKPPGAHTAHMKVLARPDTVCLLMLVALAGAGAVALAQPACVPLTERDAEYLWTYRYWQSAFDALSAACGVGLLVRDFDEDYTLLGRTALTAIGFAGALVYLAAVVRTLRRTGASLTIWRAPPVRVVLGVFCAFQAVLSVLCLLGMQLSGAQIGIADAALTGVAAFASLGFVREGAAGSSAGWIALIAWWSALGWPLWFSVIPPLMRRHVQARQALVVAGAYSLLLLLIALLVCALELPRSGNVPVGASQPFADNQASWQYGRRLVQVAAAAGAGVSTEALTDRNATEGAKVTLALTVLLGSSGYAAGGGVTWILLLWALVGALFPGSDTQRRTALGRWFVAGLSCVSVLGLLAIGGAVGLLLLESLTGSRFVHPPTFADALLDACSAVGGANLSGGVLERVTGENLVSGKNNPINLYAFGMIWMLLLMLAGRLIPLIILRRVADAVTPANDAARS